MVGELSLSLSLMNQHGLVEEMLGVNTLHALVTCPAAKRCWDRVGIGTAVQQEDTFLVWCINSFQQLDKEKRELLVALSWSIWNARNDKVWQNKIVGVDNIVTSAKTFLNQWKNAQDSVIETTFSGSLAEDAAVCWVPPYDNSVKINVDAAMFNENRQFGVGLVARDTQGLLIEGCTKLFQGQASAATAEAMGIREALSWIKKKRWTNVCIETDCLQVIQALRSTIEMRSMFGQVVNVCKDMLKFLNDVSIYFVRRSANMVAHSFARASIFYPDCTFSLESVPTDLLPTLVAEMVI
ncbi:uncharacterized protein LOC133037193 [Cannabis sativa]|uniref:uncharacterized protein LOC133037193 n=1 Tax=Cannabis sativa TaxID=3483 RepID=UPI0029C9CFAD|nr:uncharacterized protein LOC133037193 [Cannabis sativa]